MIHGVRWLLRPGRVLMVLPLLLAVLPGLALARGLLALLGESRPADPAAACGYALALLSLATGALFFAFATRYYAATMLVLLTTSLRARENGHGNGGGQGLHRIAHKARNGDGHGEPAPAQAPFVSVHIASYNEKRVLERLLECCAAFDYPSYEVVLVDDSTDETSEILARWRDRPGFKILHRPSRSGFKGGALREALRLSDPRTEFVVVFDADAMPFPDSLQRFLPHFYRQNRQGQVELRPRVGAVQSYQWHVLNKSESWLTAAVRAEYAGSYMVERVYQQDVGALKMVAGTAYMVRAELLRKLGWGTSITEDWELTLRLYERGQRVLYTPYAEAPAECVATFGRLVRQRMRWAEGHCHNVRKHFPLVMASPWVSPGEKLEFLYYAGYYLQGLWFLIGSLSWLAAEIGFRQHVPQWTATLGWSLLFTNLLSLPLMNLSGLILEEAERKDLAGVLGAVLISYLLVPFQAWAAVKGYLEVIEGPWFRTPKTGLITDEVHHLRRLRAIRRWLLQRGNGQANGNGHGDGNGHHIRANAGPPPRPPSGRLGWVVVLAMAVAVGGWAALAGDAQAAGTTFYLHGSGPYSMDTSSPSGSNQTFAMTAANATRTWASSSATTGSQTIQSSSTFALDYWTAGSGTANTNLTFGYSSSSSCAASIAKVQAGTEATSSTSTVTATLPSASTAGDLLVAAVSSFSSATISGPAGWTKAASVGGGAGEVDIWYEQNAPSTTSAAFSSTVANVQAQLTEWSGVAASGALDAAGTVTVSTNQLSATATTSGATASASELGITYFQAGNSENSMTAGSGWTHLFSDNPNGLASDYQLGLPASQTASDTETASSTAATWVGVIATFKPAAGMTTIAQATSTTLSAGSNLTTASFSPAATVTVPSGSFFCLTILVNSVTGGGLTLDYDAAANATNLTSSQAISLPQTTLYLHGAGPYTTDGTSPGGSNRAFAMTAANASRTWATPSSTAAAQTIQSGTSFQLDYWTTGSGTASTNLTLGYSSSSTCTSTIARVQLGAEQVAGSSTSVTPTLSSASTAGNLLIAVVYGNTTSPMNGPASWTRATTVSTSNVGTVEVWYYPNNPGGITSATWSITGTGTPTMGQLSEWSGVATSSPLDTSGTAAIATATTTPSVSASSATTAGGELAITGWAASVFNVASWTQGSGWTSQLKDLSNAFFSDTRTGVAAGQTVQESATAGTSASWAGNVAVFRAQPAVTTIAQSTSVTLSSGSNLTTAAFSPASNVTVPSGSYFCWTMLVNSVASGGLTLSTDAAASPTNLTSSQTIFIPELALPLAGAALLAPLLTGWRRRRGLTRRCPCARSAARPARAPARSPR